MPHLLNEKNHMNTKYSAEDTQKYLDGWQAGFTKTLMDSINKLREKAGLDIVE